MSLPVDQKTSKPKKIEVLQSGRGIAAIMVVLHHANQATNDFVGNTHENLRVVFEYGYLGVDFFFVLSGFIILYTTHSKDIKGEFKFGNYLWKRLARVFLPYWPIGIAYGLLYMFLPMMSQADRDWDWLATLTLLPTNSNTALSVAWTLRHEIFFYFLFGLLLQCRLRVVGFSFWMAAMIASLFWLPDTAEYRALRQLLGIINVEFLIGMLTAIYIVRSFPIRFRYCLLLATVPFIVWILFGANRSESWLVGLGIAPLLAGLIHLEQIGKVRQHKILVFLGDASYSVYLAHQLGISIAARTMKPMGIENSAIAFCFVATIALIFGISYYLIVERTAIRWMNSNRHNQKT